MNDTFRVLLVVGLLALIIIWRTEASAHGPGPAWDIPPEVTQGLADAFGAALGEPDTEPLPTIAAVGPSDGTCGARTPWEGGTPLPVRDQHAYDPQASGYTYWNGPSIPLVTFQGVLREASSPFLPESEAMYAILVSACIDPALWLAHAIKEGELGRTGTSRPWRGDMYGGLNNPGGVRGTTSGIQQGITPYNMGIYASYTDSVRDWVWLFTTQGLYLDAGLLDIAQVVPRYAPVTENNTAGYIQTMYRLVDELRARVDRTSLPANTDPFRAP